MNALIAVIFVLLRAGAEFLAGCFAGWLWHCWTVGRSELYLRAAIRDITARWGTAS
jgi:hypothetical protein